MKLEYRFVITGFLIGLSISLAIFLSCWAVVAYSNYKQKTFYYDGYTFWQKCKQEGKSDLQAATERYRIIHNQPYFTPEMHPDVKSGHPEGFIRGTLGYELWDGFGYGKKPTRIGTFFECKTMHDTVNFIAMLHYIPYIAMLVSPFACVCISYVAAKVKINILKR